MQDQALKSTDLHICPRCGTENAWIPDLWLSSMGEGEQPVCSNCGETLVESQNPGIREGEEKGKSGFNVGFFMVAALLTGLIVYLNRTFDVLSFKQDSGQIIYEILLVLIVSASIASGKIWSNLRHLAIWAAIFLIMIVGYSYRHEISAVKDRVFAELVPSKGYQNTVDSISYPVSSDGHFYIVAVVNGTPITFLADTGASHIVLSPADAERIGFKKSELNFDRFYETANGTVRGSSIRIADFRVGEIHLKDIGASVNEAEMRNSLLGMTFFKRLNRYEVKDDVLTLYRKR